MKNITRLWIHGTVAMVACSLFADGNLFAATYEWNDAAGGLWNDPAKWTLTSGSGTAPPDVGDTAEFKRSL